MNLLLIGCSFFALFLSHLNFMSFFEYLFKERINESSRSMIILIVSIIPSFYMKEFHLEIVVVIWIVMYMFFLYAFQLTCWRDLILTIMCYLLAILVIFSILSFGQYFFKDLYIHMIYIENLSFLISSIIFYLLLKIGLKRIHFQVFYSLNIKQLFFSVFFIVFSIIFICFLYQIDLYVKDAGMELMVAILSAFLSSFEIFFIWMLSQLGNKFQLEHELIQMEKDMQIRYEYYKQLEKKQEDVSFLFHDLRNHLQMIQNEKSSSVYIHELTSKMTEMEQPCFSSNKSLQILLSDKDYECRRKHITLHVKNEDFDMGFIKEYDKVIIFSNLLDNAMEALENAEQEMKWIQLLIRRIRGMAVIQVTNPLVDKVEKENENFKSTKKNHTGLGIRSVEKVIQNYNGSLYITTEKQIFDVTIMISMP